jgi:hypothetical protein
MHIGNFDSKQKKKSETVTKSMAYALEDIVERIAICPKTE